MATQQPTASDVFEGEVWQDIPGWLGIQGSSLGRVRSLRLDDGAFDGNGVILNHFIVSPGYPMLKIDGKLIRVHSLILLAFVGPRPEGFVSRHLDDNKLNNHIDNLRYGTASQNSRDAIRNGTAPVGSKKWNAVLCEADIDEVKRLRRLGLSHAAIGRRLGVSSSRISFILSGKNWSHCLGDISDLPRRVAPPGKRISDKDVLAIRAAKEAGTTTRELAVRYEVSTTTIQKLVSGKHRSTVVRDRDAII